MLQKINNPKSTSYLNFKEYCKSRHITWNWLEHNCEPKNNHKNATTVRPESWNDESINFGFYAHLFLILILPPSLNLFILIPMLRFKSDFNFKFYVYLELNFILI